MYKYVRSAQHILFISKAKSWHCIILGDLDLWLGDLVHVHDTKSHDKHLWLKKLIHVTWKFHHAQRSYVMDNFGCTFDLLWPWPFLCAKQLSLPWKIFVLSYIKIHPLLYSQKCFNLLFDPEVRSLQQTTDFFAPHSASQWRTFAPNYNKIPSHM
jgi:hypothetical protein